MSVLGDPMTGRVSVQFGSMDILQEFIDLLNKNDIHRSSGERMTFEAHSYWPGEAVIEFTLNYDEEKAQAKE